MLHLFRSFMNSKVGVIVTLAFLVVIAIAFAVGDVTSTGSSFGGISSGDRVAVVGDRKITAQELETAVRSEFDAYRQQNPTATMETFIAGGGFERTLDSMLDRNALAEFARQHGLRAGDRLVDSEITKIPAFAGPDGKFSQETYRALLAQRGLNDEQVRDDLRNGIYVRQAITPVLVPSSLPKPLVKRYAALVEERRQGEIGLLLSTAYAPTGEPTDAQLTKFYNDNRAAYMRPERRVIRYATFGAETLKGVPAPTEAEITARYNRDKSLYTAVERRRLTQLVVPTEAAAKAIIAEVGKGKSLDVAAREKGLSVTSVGPIARDAFASQSSALVAQAAFSTAQGRLAAPARGPLGFYVLRVDGIEQVAGRTQAQVRGQIVEALAKEKHDVALANLGAEVEEAIDSGSSLADVARAYGMTLQTTPELVGTGAVYGKPGEGAPEILRPAIQTAFDMEQGNPQLTEIEAGKTYMVFDVSKITAATPAPLPEIRPIVVASWRKAEGDKKAKAAAERVLKLVEGGQTIAAAMAKEGVTLPPPDKVNMNRDQLRQLGQRVPPVMALLFSMAEGTVKRLEAPNDNGWFVVKLDDIEPGKIADNDPRIEQATRELAAGVGEEFAAQFAAAARADVGVERNEDAIAALKKRLTNGN